MFGTVVAALLEVSGLFLYRSWTLSFEPLAWQGCRLIPFEGKLQGCSSDGKFDLLSIFCQVLVSGRASGFGIWERELVSNRHRLQHLGFTSRFRSFARGGYFLILVESFC